MSTQSTERLYEVREEVMIQQSEESLYSEAIYIKNKQCIYQRIFKHIYWFKNIKPLHKILLIHNKKIKTSILLLN